MLLRTSSRGEIPWAVFHPDWYLETYTDVRARLTDTSFDGVLRHYLDVGQAAGHSPNPYFDEAWYRATYEDVLAAIADGQVESGFDQYCREGFSNRSPHWLFDEARYRERYLDLTDAALAARHFVNGYAHYLRHGDREGRVSTSFFDPTVVRPQLSEAEVAALPADGPFTAFLRRRPPQPEYRTTRYFDPRWYRDTYPSAAATVDAGQYRSVLHHYLTNTTPTAFDPLPIFSERAYLAAYPDVAEAVAEGAFRNGYQHFLANGVAELRVAGPLLDLQWYVVHNVTVGEDLAAGRAPDAFTHYLTIGMAAGLAGAPPVDPVTPHDEPMALYRVRGSAPLPGMARRGLDFTCSDSPTLSIIMVLHDEFALALQSLAALRDRTSGDIELTLIDSGSRDETRHIHRYVRGARLLRFDQQVSAAAARNAAIDAVSAPTTLLLGSDTEPAHDAVGAALARLNSDQRIGAVGGRVVGPDGRLRMAGGIIWRDGGLLPYLRDYPPLAPEANFVRGVDFCSSAFLLARTDVLQKLGGFDAQFTNQDYADADLCVRVTAADYRVVYDPNVLTYQLGVSSPAANLEEQKAFFFRKHINQLRFHYLADPKVEIFARSLDTHNQRILFIEDLVPLRMIGSGFVRSNDIVRVLTSMGVFVTVFPTVPSPLDIAAVYAEMPDTVEVMHDRSLADLDALFRERPDYYDVIWVTRTHNLDPILMRLKQITTSTGRPPWVVLDTEAIAAIREAQRHRLTGQEGTFDLEAAIRKEFASAHDCQSIAVVSEQEATILRSLGLSDVKVIGHIRDLTPTLRTFDERSGLLFIGAIHEVSSPNYDSLCWFVDEVLPLIERDLGWETRLTIAGYLGEGVSLDRFKDHPRVTLRGAVADTERLYNAHRIFVAPTRYAAGTPYKLHEAASFGLPIVATTLLREQMGWTDDKELLSADSGDPAQFARQVIRLYRDRALWQTLRDNALARLAAENSRENYVQAINEILGGSV